MEDFFTRLLDTSDFPPRWHCGVWSSGHGWLHVLADLGVWSAYVSIPLVLGYFTLHRKELPFRGIFWLFCEFILACGTTHLMEAVIFWWPAYRLAGLVKLFTAVVSWTTVVALVPVTPRALALRGPEELEREVAERQRAQKALLQAHDELERRVQERTEELARANRELHQEISDRRRAEEAMRGSEQRFARFMQHLPGLAWIKDKHGHYEYANDDAAKAFRFPPAKLYGKTDAEVFPPETAGQFQEHDRQVLASGTGMRTTETLEHEDGTLHYSIVSKFPIPGPEGEALIGGIAIDITDRKVAEDALRRAQGDLERQVQEKTADLATRIRELEAALTQVRQLRGLLPICSYCKKIRGDQNYWQQVETYLSEHAEVRFSHGICPDCLRDVVGPQFRDAGLDEPNWGADA